MKKYIALLLSLVLLAGCRAEQPRLLPEGTVTAVAVSNLPEGYDYSFTAGDAQAVADYLSGLTLTAKFPENPNEYAGMTWVIELSYENGNTVTVYHFGNMFVRADDGPWYKMAYEEANRLGTLLHELGQS